jgi:glutathione S-transferase
MPKLHGANLSPFVRKTRVFLAEKNLRYELVPLIPFNPPAEFLKISPLGKIPVYQDGDFTLPDSSCICLYLERVQPTPPLYPQDARLYGRALFYEEYADTRLVETLGPVFFERVVKKLIMKQQPDEARCREQIDTKAPAVFDWLESQVGGKEAVVGGRFSIADIAIASPFVNFEHAGEKVDAKRWPGLAAYVERIHSRPSFKTLIEEEQKGLPR